MVSLLEALKVVKLQDFILQEEDRGIGPVSKSKFNNTASSVIKTPPQDDQTSRSLPDDGSPEK